MALHVVLSSVHLCSLTLLQAGKNSYIYVLFLSLTLFDPSVHI